MQGCKTVLSDVPVKRYSQVLSHWLCNNNLLVQVWPRVSLHLSAVTSTLKFRPFSWSHLLQRVTSPLQGNFQNMNFCHWTCALKWFLKERDLWETRWYENRTEVTGSTEWNTVFNNSICIKPTTGVNKYTLKARPRVDTDCDWIENRISGAGRNLLLMCISWFI